MNGKVQNRKMPNQIHGEQLREPNYKSLRSLLSPRGEGSFLLLFLLGEKNPSDDDVAGGKSLACHLGASASRTDQRGHGGGGGRDAGRRLLLVALAHAQRGFGRVGRQVVQTRGGRGQHRLQPLHFLHLVH